MSYAPKDRRGRGWWGYIKFCIRQYDSIEGPETELERKEVGAVARAVEETRTLKDGNTRLELIRLVYWKRSHTVPGAAMEIHVSERTALRWHGEFIRTVAREFFGSDLSPVKTEKGKGKNE